MSTVHGPAVFQPGDGTRYVLMLTHIENARCLGYGGGCYQVSVLNLPGHTWTVPEDFIGPYDLPDHRDLQVNPWTRRAILLWLEQLKIDGFTVDIPEQMRRGV